MIAHLFQLVRTEAAVGTRVINGWLHHLLLLMIAGHRIGGVLACGHLNTVCSGHASIHVLVRGRLLRLPTSVHHHHHHGGRLVTHSVSRVGLLLLLLGLHNILRLFVHLLLLLLLLLVHLLLLLLQHELFLLLLVDFLLKLFLLLQFNLLKVRDVDLERVHLVQVLHNVLLLIEDHLTNGALVLHGGMHRHLLAAYNGESILVGDRRKRVQYSARHLDCVTGLEGGHRSRQQCRRVRDCQLDLMHQLIMFQQLCGVVGRIRLAQVALEHKQILCFRRLGSDCDLLLLLASLLLLLLIEVFSHEGLLLFV